jgi:5-methyltetrahydropteroyltriglutamate--homocysteine methyltransferase
VTVALDDQLRAGLDVVTDGEMRRVNFIMGFYERLDGVVAREPFRKLGLPLYDRETLYETTGRVTAPNGLGAVDEFRFLRGRTDKPIKVPVPGPLTLRTPMVLGAGYRQEGELIADLAAIVRRELEALQAAGCEFVQIDEPSFHETFQNDLSGATRLFNDLVAGLTMKVALHVCFGNNSGRPRTRRTWRPLVPFLRDTKCSQLVLEFANREMAELDLWPEYGGDKELACGVVDQKSFYREKPEEVADRARLALRYVDPAKLWLNPDCGLMVTPRWIGKAKLRALVDGARIVRRELAG